MSANRVIKRSRNTTSERHSLISWIQKFGVTSPDVMPCTPCYNAGTADQCKLDPNGRSKRCLSCVQNSLTCDGVLVGQSLDSTLRSIDKLEDQEMEAESQLLLAQQQALAAQQKASEVLSRLARIRKQKRFLRDRGEKLFDRGIIEVDRLDSVNADLPDVGSSGVQRLESQAVENAHSVGASDVVDWNVIFSDGSQMAGDEFSQWEKAFQTVESGPSNL
ncbi:hypothetical protein LEL_11005 [Akanthomyces lecanii RCEF 1005]|uniref:Uncharacterized protein n=1 Tax=Akanthomyces lecanii RCEF 1005 TaxID=1081108 RepID=A0A167MKM4_CORDF|nr:hypothetical protein LEL_11009 [Akanthomyces lecanii RCEF 1005]OAA54474.1 hypothetical protein LEL_11005 [Akanthomyces lecanii RCEF 1005]